MQNFEFCAKRRRIDDQYIKQIELIVLSLKNEIVGH